MAETLIGAILESLAFDGIREPIASVDLVGGASSPNVSGRRLALEMQATQALFNTALGTTERLRTPTKFFSAATVNANGAFTFWTPAAGKKFRLQAYRIHISGDAALAVAARVGIFLTDGGVGIFAGARDFDIWIPAAAGVTPALYVGPWVILPGNGYLSSAANNALAIQGNAAGALTNGVIQVLTVGSEE